MLLLYLAVPSVVKTEMCDCPKIIFRFEDKNYYDPAATPCLREALQAELTSTTNIRNLQNAFYPSQTTPRVYIHTTVGVNITCELREECNSSLVFSWRHIWYEENVIGKLTTRELILASPVATLLGVVQTFDLLELGDYEVPLNIQLNCVFRHEPNEVEEKIGEIWEGILQWVSSETQLWCMHVSPKPKSTPVRSTSTWERRVSSDSCHAFMLSQSPKQHETRIVCLFNCEV